MNAAKTNVIVLDNLENPIEAIISNLDSTQDNLFLKSVVPNSCQTDECIVGIDEAGRGPVLGPMVYGICYCSKNHKDILTKLGCADSKALSEEKREDIFRRMNQELAYLGWTVDIISPNQISNCMLRRQKYSLNEISHSSAINLIQNLIDRKVNVTEVYVDTVGPPEKYEEKLSKIFRGIKINVSKKADALFPIVSAASICAKVIRDLALKNWKFSEDVKTANESGWGSGYPGDATTKSYLVDNMDPIFGFPKIVRFSWSTAEAILEDKGVPVEWSDDEDNEGNAKVNGQPITNFFKQPVSKHTFFKERCLQSVETL